MTANNKKHEKRRARRLAYSASIKVYRLDNETSKTHDAFLFETKDLTQSGLFITTAKPFPLNTKLKIEWSLSGSQPPIIAHGRVARVVKPDEAQNPGMGIELTGLKDEDVKKVRMFLKDKFRNYRHALELKSMYLQLKQMAARLYELEEYHKEAEHFRTVVEHAVKEIDYIAHVLDKEVWEIKRL